MDVVRTFLRRRLLYNSLQYTEYDVKWTLYEHSYDVKR